MGHRLFAAMVVAALVVRLVAVAGYTPALYYNDSYEYVGVALRPQPYVVRPSGYSFFLVLLLPFHSFRLVVLVQHLLGLAIAVMVYALLRRYGVPAWVAAAATAPQLFDGHQIQLEHMILSEALFTFLVVGAVVSLLWWRPVPTWVCLVAGGLLAMASLTRVVGIPLAVVVAVWLLTRRTGARPLAAYAAAFAIPLVAYAGWYWSYHGKPGITGSSGIFLYSRTASFADCSQIDPRPELALLCPTEPSGERQPPSNYIWHPDVPLASIPGPIFSEYKDSAAGDFARQAVFAQPLDYTWVAVQDFARTFGSRLTDYPTADLTRHYRFQDPPIPVTDRTIIPGGTIPDDVRAYEHGEAGTRAHPPLAGWLIAYQRHVAVPGPVLGFMLLASLAALASPAASRLRSRAWRWSPQWFRQWPPRWPLQRPPQWFRQWPPRWPLQRPPQWFRLPSPQLSGFRRLTFGRPERPVPVRPSSTQPPAAETPAADSATTQPTAAEPTSIRLSEQPLTVQPTAAESTTIQLSTLDRLPGPLHPVGQVAGGQPATGQTPVRHTVAGHRARRDPARAPAPAGSAAGPPSAGAPLSLFTATAFALLLVPPLTAGFDHRYVTPVLVFLSAGAGLAFHIFQQSARPGRSLRTHSRARGGVHRKIGGPFREAFAFPRVGARNDTAGQQEHHTADTA